MVAMLTTETMMKVTGETGIIMKRGIDEVIAIAMKMITDNTTTMTAGIAE